MSSSSSVKKTDAGRIRIVHVITGLNVGGAERMLWKLLAHSDRSRFDMRVLSLLDGGRLAEEIRRLDIPVTHLGIQSPGGAFKALFRLRRYLRAAPPDILQGWMYHGHLAAWCGRLLMEGRVPLIWGVRQSLYDLSREKRVTALVIRFCARISKAATRILYNSETARGHHERIGYAPLHGDTIPNGFEVDVFRPDDGARAALRHELGLEKEALLVGMVARFDPMKGHANFLDAIARLATQCTSLHFVLIGNGVDRENPLFARMSDQPGVSGRIHCLGERRDIPALTAALDVAVIPSISEGFANAIGEAMSCGVPCVVTDVGDSASVVAGTGRVVPPADPVALAHAISELLQLPGEERRRLGLQARQRVIEKFSIEAVVKRYAALYESVAPGRSA